MRRQSRCRLLLGPAGQDGHAGGASENILPEQSLGLVTLGFGDNLRFDGANAAPGWSVPLTRATIVADSVTILRTAGS